MQRRRCVMVVDREPLAQWALAELAKDAGWTVITATSPEVALQFIRELPAVDLLFLDCPRTWADLTIVSAIKRMRPDCKVVLILDFRIDAFASRASALGVDQTLIKPVDADAVREILGATDVDHSSAAAPALKPWQLRIPSAAESERSHLQMQLAGASGEPGAMGDLARSLQRLLEPHTHHEERYALPLLGLLPLLAAGFVWPEMQVAVTMSATLASDLPRLLDDHEALITAAEQLEHAAQSAGRLDLASLARSLVRHVELETQVMYPAAILTGKFVEMQLARTRMGPPN